MDFSSDTAAPAHPSIIEAIARANQGMAASYGNDDIMARLRVRLRGVLETDDFDFWIVGSGTASNALALSVLCPPTGSILCHEEAHIERDERGAPEFFTGGGKLSLLPGTDAKIDADALRAALNAIDESFVHETPARVLSLTNLTESGCVYYPSEIALYADLAKAKGLAVHLDGARLANALVTCGATPSEMSWKAGVDVLSLGLTKAGAIGCELIILFGPARTKFAELKVRAKRAGHMPPKMRFMAAQAEAMLTDALWLKLAGQANSAAGALAEGLVRAGGELVHPVEGNEVFVRLPDGADETLRAKQVEFYPWPDGSHRFVCNWTTEAADIEALVNAL